jgi:hypothetical protein
MTALVTTARESWDPLEHSINKVWLAQMWSPGICDIEGADSVRKYESVEAYGESGALLNFKGVDAARFRIRLRLYTSADWSDWQSFRLRIFAPPTDTKPQALDVWHPLLWDQGIHRLVIENFVQPIQTDDGVWTAELRCIEWRMLQPALTRVAGSKATANDPEPGPTPLPASKNQMLIASLLKQVQELAK